jgi:hypothetical protein
MLTDVGGCRARNDDEKGADRMTLEEVVRKVLFDEHADVIREAVRAIAVEMMELEVSKQIVHAAAALRTTSGPTRAP